MKPLFYPLSVLFLILALTTKAQSAKQGETVSKTEISVVDFTSPSEPSDGVIYVLSGKYYAAASFQSLVSNLKIDPSKEIDHADVHQPGSEKIKDIKNRLPQKYLNNFKGIIEIYLRK